MPTSNKPIRHIALDLLARREHSAHELSNKLSLRGYTLEEISPLLDILQQQNLLNHGRYIEHYIHHRQTKGFGPHRIHAELLERGIPQELIDQAINFTDNAWIAEAFRAWQKRFNNTKPKDFKSRTKQMHFLHYRGFTREQIESVLESTE